MRLQFSTGEEISSKAIFSTEARLMEQVSKMSPPFIRMLLKNIFRFSGMLSRSVKNGWLSQLNLFKGCVSTDLRVIYLP